MAYTFSYEEGYKRGVESVLQGVLDGIPYDGTRTLDRIVNDLRKKLLTKKVTKWVAIFAGSEVPLWPDSKLFDSDPSVSFAECANFRGAYPIEIEVPL